MERSLKEFFRENKIEYFSVLRYTDCREISRGIMEREDFAPRSVIVYLLPYYAGETENLSRYAAARDYHIALRQIGEGLVSIIKSATPGASAKAYGDHSPIDEVNAALVAGLGVMGDNKLLLNEKYGSYVFIGDVITDVDPDTLGAVTPTLPGECHHCGICKASCPTGILSGSCDSCLSAITQRRGELADNEREIMRKVNTVWGCDECQRLCPYNASPTATPIEFFREKRIEKLTRELVDGMNKEDFRERAFSWRGRKTVLRNLDIVLGGE